MLIGCPGQHEVDVAIVGMSGVSLQKENFAKSMDSHPMLVLVHNKVRCDLKDSFISDIFTAFIFVHGVIFVATIKAPVLENSMVSK